MQGKKQLRNLFLNLLAREATAALATAIVFALTVALNQTAQAQTPTTGGGWTEQVLHSFNDNGTDGNQPEAALISHSAGSLYGTTAWGGIYGYGTVFELTSTAGAGWMEKVLHSFNYNGTDGFQPTAGLILRVADNLYSTTYAGGTHDWGTVFELKPSPDAAGGGWTEKVLHSFNAYQ